MTASQRVLICYVNVTLMIDLSPWLSNGRRIEVESYLTPIPPYAASHVVFEQLVQDCTRKSGGRQSNSRPLKSFILHNST